MYQRILVPIDGSGTSNRGLKEALQLARATGAHLRLLHVMDRLSFATGFEACASCNSDVVPLMKGAAERILDDGSHLAEAAGILFDTQLIDNFALPIANRVEECVNEWKADLVVIGTHGRRGFKRFLMGSDAEQIMRRSPVPILLVKGAEVAEVKDAHAAADTCSGKACEGACPCAARQAA